MSRTRIAIAHFAGAEAAAAARHLLLEQGASDITIRPDEQAGPRDACRLEVTLSEPLARQLLNILLGSEATRVDVHDVD
jgi:hypothetical protein